MVKLKKIILNSRPVFLHQERIRALWRHYYQNCDGLIFVVDSCDGVRVPEAKEELDGILSHPVNIHYHFQRFHMPIKQTDRWTDGHTLL